MTDFNKLISWYKRAGRALPWRNNPNPYHIWLSEIILQQTRVEQGLPWYYSFVENFPTVFDLAQAPEDKVLKLWQGLGYYSRARNLRTAAIEICNNHEGRFPENPEMLQKLKGIGPYTSAAIASFAYNYPAIALDGNLLRIAARYFMIEDPIDKKATQKLISELYLDKLQGFASSDFNQALMDLGALICLPSSPKCGECPLNEGCIARIKGKTLELPVKQNRTKVKEVHIWYVIFKKDDKILFRKRENKGIWQNMYDFVSVESGLALSHNQALTELSLSSKAESLKIHVFPGRYTHILSHRKLQASFLMILNHEAGVIDSGIWVDRKQFLNLAIPRLIEKFLNDYHAEIWGFS